MKFKVGETVYIKPRLMKGYVTSVEASLTYPYTVLREGKNEYYSERELESVEEEGKEMTQETHDYEEGKWYMWGGGECPLHPKDSYVTWCMDLPSGAMTERGSMGNHCWKHKDTFLKVSAFKITKKYTPPVTKEMTVEEISKALGYDVKIVKG